MFESIEVNYLLWWAVGAVLVILEFLAPGVVFLWLAIAAALTGLIDLVFGGLSWQVQILVFGLLSLGSVFLGRYYVYRHPIETSDPTLNERGQQLVGRTVQVVSPIKSGTRGRVKVGDSVWTAEGADAEVDSYVKVTGAKGTILTVVPVTPDPADSPAE